MDIFCPDAISVSMVIALDVELQLIHREMVVLTALPGVQIVLAPADVAYAQWDTKGMEVQIRFVKLLLVSKAVFKFSGAGTMEMDLVDLINV